MIPSAAWRYWRLNDSARSERDSDAAATAAAKIDNAFEWPGQPPKIAPSPLGIFIQNGMSIGSAVFAQRTVVCPITLQQPLRSPKSTPSLGRSGPHLTRST